MRVGWALGLGMGITQERKKNVLLLNFCVAKCRAVVSFERTGVFGEEGLGVFLDHRRQLGGSGCSHQILEGFLLVLLGSVIQHDSDDHQHCPDGRKASDLVPEDYNAEPDGQGVLHRAGHAVGRTGKQEETEKKLE